MSHFASQALSFSASGPDLDPSHSLVLRKPLKIKIKNFSQALPCNGKRSHHVIVVILLSPGFAIDSCSYSSLTHCLCH